MFEWQQRCKQIKFSIQPLSMSFRWITFRNTVFRRGFEAVKTKKTKEKFRSCIYNVIIPKLCCYIYFVYISKLYILTLKSHQLYRAKILFFCTIRMLFWKYIQTTYLLVRRRNKFMIAHQKHREKNCNFVFLVCELNAHTHTQYKLHSFTHNKKRYKSQHLIWFI